MERTDATDRPLDTFLIGPENALAHASVLALARGEVQGLSPLIVHGPAGSGKSRLLAGLVAEWLARHPGSAVAHLEAEAFALACAGAAGRSGSGGWAELRDRFRHLDLFVIEDLDALAGAPLALAELGHTLDALSESGAAVAASAREGPGSLGLGPGAKPGGSGRWPSRLVNRLSGGLAVRLDPPGPALRRRYVLERARALGLALAAEAVEALADRADGFRTLDGQLARLALADRLDGEAKAPGALDQARALALLADDTEAADASGGRAALERITRAVAVRFGVRLRDLRSASRRQALVVPRHLAIYLGRRQTGLSYAALGAYFGGRDPATVRHACRAAAARLAADPALAAALGGLEAGEP